jgi:hypothetical protein
MASPFIAAMDKTNHLQHGENGSPEFTASGVEESRVALFFALVRDIPSERLYQLLHTVVLDGKDNEEVAADLFLMTFQTRHCRGGKGEKDLFYRMIMELSTLYPNTVSSLMNIIPHYGSYKDWFKIVEWSRDEEKTPKHEVRNAMSTITNIIMDLARDQLIKDRKILEKGESTNGISLLAKWAPREGKGMSKLAKELANKVFPDSKAPKKEYRQLLSRLNAAINTLEIKMSNKEWDTIDFTKDVPSVSLMKYRKAFLNEVVKGQPPIGDEEETGNRHPEDTVRVKCRTRLRETMMSEKAAKLKGKQLFPHEIVQKFMNDGNGQLSTLEKDILSCQWNDIRKNVVEALEKAKISGKEEEGGNKEKPGPSIDLGKMVSLVDVSGSMGGTPMEVAIALGLLVSEIASPAYNNRCLTFSETPTWVELHQSMSLYEKVKKMQNAPWGMSTDFEAATEKILKVAVEGKLNPEDIPDLIVFSDMQFDQARQQLGGYGHQQQSNGDGWETHHQRIVRRFKEEGLKVCGKEWPAPHIIYWNLRGKTYGFPAQADTPGVTMLSGYSPSLMKLLLNGDPIEEEEGTIDENGIITKKAKKNPFMSVRKALDSEDYDQVRDILYASNEGILRKYVEKQVAKEVTAGNREDSKEEMETDNEEWEVVP